jgi:hypothetical protein
MGSRASLYAVMEKNPTHLACRLVTILTEQPSVSTFNSEASCWAWFKTNQSGTSLQWYKSNISLWSDQIQETYYDTPQVTFFHLFCSLFLLLTKIYSCFSVKNLKGKKLPWRTGNSEQSSNNTKSLHIFPTLYVFTPCSVNTSNKKCIVRHQVLLFRSNMVKRFEKNIQRNIWQRKRISVSAYQRTPCPPTPT